jgi:hypothetical protein
MKKLKVLAIALRLAAAAAFLAFQAVAAFAQSPSALAVTTNRSATITTGNTFQAILAKTSPGGTPRRSLTIQNNNATDSCWIAFGTTAGGTVITAANATTAESILLQAGQAFTRYFPYVPSDEIEGTCATTADTIYVDTQ